jgi:2-haloacid dehalogenase
MAGAFAISASCEQRSVWTAASRTIELSVTIADPGPLLRMPMKHTLFLFDLDDTLLDFKASEGLSFERTLRDMGFTTGVDELFSHYQVINTRLWRDFELGLVSKDVVKVERFRRTFFLHGLDLDAELASHRYLESLSETVILIDGAKNICQQLAEIGEVGVITNGVASIQTRRINSSGLGEHISFVATSEACGFAKPDSRFFEYTAAKAKAFSKAETVIIGDRLDADILGANQFGIESCWYNPGRLVNDSNATPTYETDSLHKLMAVLD